MKKNNEYKSLLKKENNQYCNTTKNYYLYLKNDDALYEGDKYKFSVKGDVLFFNDEQYNKIVEEELQDKMCEELMLSKFKKTEWKDAIAIIKKELANEKPKVDKSKLNIFENANTLKDRLILSDRETILQNVNNYMTLLDEIYGKDAFRLNTFAGTQEMVNKANKLRFKGCSKTCEYDQLIDRNVDVIALDVENKALEIDNNFIVNNNSLNKAISNIAQNNTYNPILEWYESLEWDGVERMENFFIEWMGTDDTNLNKEMTKIWFNGLIRRSYEPGCKMDYLLVLISDAHGTGKSSIAGKLLPNHLRQYYCADFKPDGKDKDTYDILNRSVLVNFDEMSKFDKSNLESLKSLITLTQYTARLSYERRSTTFKSHHTFIATTNRQYFLRDDTGDGGERRFFTMEVTKEYNNGIRVNRDLTEDITSQVMAEAVYKYKNNLLPLYLTEEYYDELKEVQRQFKSFNNNDSLDEVDTILNRKYKLNERGEFESELDAISQLSGEVERKDADTYLSRIPTVLLRKVVNTSTQNIRSKYKYEWNFKKAGYYAGRQYGGYIMERKNSIHSEKSLSLF